MNNKTGFNRLGLKTSHRKALKRNMVISLFKYEQITTTKAKAKEVRRMAEKLITRAKKDSVHNRRQAARLIHDKAILNKLFSDLSKRYETRPGGYTRIVKMGFRQGDAADMVILELVDKVRGSETAVEEKSAKTKKTAPVAESAAPKKAETAKAKPATTSKPKTTRTSAKPASETKDAQTGAKKVQRGGSARGK